MPQNNPLAGEVYRHFKGKMYKVVTIAAHSETGEALVIYQGLYGDFAVYARPYESFVETLDSKKYPNASSEYRFTYIQMGIDEPEKKASISSVKEEDDTDEAYGTVKNGNKLLAFLDEDDFEKKYDILCEFASDELTDTLIDNMAVSLDVVIKDGPIDVRFEELKQCVRTRKKFEISRLR